MNTAIEKYLAKNKSFIVEKSTLMSILSNLGYLSINDKISDLKKKGILISLKKGLYVYRSSINENVVSKELMANNLFGPSYISMDYALSFHGMIPEKVFHVTSVTTKRSVSFENHFGTFSYRQIATELFNLGLQIINSEWGNFLMASKEKALCDKMFLTKDLKITSLKDVFEFLEQDLRIETDELINLNHSVIENYYRISKSKKIGLLNKFLVKL